LIDRDALRKEMMAQFKTTHKRSDEILTQVKVTNGRVTKLESWKDQFMGFLKAVAIIGTLIAFALKMGWVSFG